MINFSNQSLCDQTFGEGKNVVPITKEELCKRNYEVGITSSQQRSS